MAVKASAQITITYVVDVKAVYRYYLLQSSTASTPSKPTTFPPSSSWDDTEPTYTEGSTNSLYFVDCTVLADDSFTYSEVSLSSSYEAAKLAYNKAINAQNTANSAQEDIDNLTFGGRNLIVLSNSIDDYRMDSSGANFSATGATVTDYIPIRSGESVILTAYEAYTANEDSYWQVAFYDTDQIFISRPIMLESTITEKTSWFATVPDTACYFRVAFPTAMKEKVKLEYGTKPTDWSPAPEDVETKIDSVQNTVDNTRTYTHTVLSVDSGSTLTYFDFSGYMEVGTLTDGADVDSESYVRSSEYVKVIGGNTYIWEITDLSGTALTPVTHFYTYDSDNETYTYLSSQSSTTITSPSSTDDIYLRFTVALSSDDISNTSYELTLNDLDSIITSQTINVYSGTYTTLDSYMSLDASDYVWELTDTSALKNATELAEQLNEQLNDETDGVIKKLYTGIEEAKDSAEEAKRAVDNRQKYVQINPDDPSISLITSGDINNPGTKVVLDSNKISFYKGSTEGAYIGYVDSEQSDRTSMAVSKTYVTEMYPRVEDPTAQNTWIGQLCWVARTNGHLSLKVVK